MASQQGSSPGIPVRWLLRSDGELSRPRLGAAAAVAALAGAALAWLLGAFAGLAGIWALLTAAIATGAALHLAVVLPLVGHLNQRLGSAEAEIADTVQRLRVVKAAQPASALTDELTLLPSRRVVTSSILEHMAHAERYGNPLSVAYVELNDYERIRTEYGAGVAAQALKAVADAFADTLRMPDKAGRCDGHTFLVVLPHTTLKAANAIGARLRKNVAGRHVRHLGQDIPLAISIGAAQFRQGDDLEKLLERARQAMQDRPAPARRARGSRSAKTPASGGT